jgi:hypothetical protein
MSTSMSMEYEYEYEYEYESTVYGVCYCTPCMRVQCMAYDTAHYV